MKVFWNAWIQSVKLPQKKAVFALNRVGMDMTVIYMFILLALASIPSLVDQLAVNQSSEHIRTFFFVIFFFIFYYLVLVVIVFGLISFIAYIVTAIAKRLERKLRYSILWKMTAFAMTIPLTLFTILSFIYPLTSVFLIVSTVYLFVVIIKIILIYPRRKKDKS